MTPQAGATKGIIPGLSFLHSRRIRGNCTLAGQSGLWQYPLGMEAFSDDQDKHSEILIGFGLLLATALVFCLGVLLVWFATLRENEAFWTYAGGYPIWLRDLVLLTYLPLLFAAVLLLAGLSMAGCSKVCRSPRFWVLESLLLLVCWGLVATSGYIAFEDNIANLLDGQDLHHHNHIRHSP